MTSTPEVDARLIGARDLALAALYEITPAATVGPPADYIVEDDATVSLRFENRLPGYPGWFWTVTVARVEGEEPTVVEVELMPGEGALLAPDWVPWAERLAEYRAHAAELAAAKSTEDDDDDDSDDDDEDADSDDDDESDDEDDFLDEHDAHRLHSGDVDGVDIDELDDSIDEDDDARDSDDEEE